jgi:hypothetical protein
LQTAQQTFASAQAVLDRSQQTAVQTAQNDFSKAQSELDRAQQTALTDKSITAQAALQTAQQTFVKAQAELDRSQQTTLATAEQTATQTRQTADNVAQLERLNLQINSNLQNIPAAFAANISNTTMNGVNALMADPNLSATNDGYLDSNGNFVKSDTVPKGSTPSSPKTRAIENVMSYANAQIDWANTFYKATIPPLNATPGSDQFIGVPKPAVTQPPPNTVAGLTPATKPTLTPFERTFR